MQECTESRGHAPPEHATELKNAIKATIVRCEITLVNTRSTFREALDDNEATTAAAKQVRKLAQAESDKEIHTFNELGRRLNELGDSHTIKPFNELVQKRNARNELLKNDHIKITSEWSARYDRAKARRKEMKTVMEEQIAMLRNIAKAAHIDENL
jgi:hypothetical protein